MKLYVVAIIFTFALLASSALGAGGGISTTTYTTSSSFSITVPTLINYIIVGGGGGGGGGNLVGNSGPGGGGGGAVVNGSLQLNPGTYTITVGMGGAGGLANAAGSSGGVSSLTGTGVSIQALGGGGGNFTRGDGGFFFGARGLAGNSNGGDGGDGYDGASRGGNDGKGVSGKSISIVGYPATIFACGGGGGGSNAAGTGGGTTRGLFSQISNGNGTDGVANTGGGGGGATGDCRSLTPKRVGGAGASGLVVVTLVCQQDVTGCDTYSATCFGSTNQQTCTACASEYYFTSASNTCTACTACSSTQYQTTACSGTQDRVCATCSQQSVTNCGSYGATCFGGANQQTCTACSNGYYLQGTLNTCSIANPVGPSPTPQQQQFVDTSGQTIATVSFAGVTGGGATTVVPLASGDVGFVALPSLYTAGTTPVYYDISTTATFTPPVTICLTYSNPSGTPHLLHYTGSTWTDVTTSINSGPPLSICGQVTSFSNFAVGYDAGGFNGGASNDPHLVGATGVKYDFDGASAGNYTLFSSPQFQVSMQLSDDDGPSTRFMTEIGVLFSTEVFLFDSQTMSQSFHDDLQQRLIHVGGKLLSWSSWQVKMELCHGHLITISQMHTREPWLAHADGSPWYYLDVDITLPHCDNAYDGALGQTYKCEYVSGETDFVWSHGQEESFRIPNLSAATKPFQVDSKCPDNNAGQEAAKDQEKED